MRAVMGGKVTLGKARWLRCKGRVPTCGRLGVSENSLVGWSRGGEASLDTSSALPSRESDKRTCGWGGGSMGAAEPADSQEEGGHGSDLQRVNKDLGDQATERPYLGVLFALRLSVDGVENELAGFHRFDRNPMELEKEKDAE